MCSRISIVNWCSGILIGHKIMPFQFNIQFFRGIFNCIIQNTDTIYTTIGFTRFSVSCTLKIIKSPDSITIDLCFNNRNTVAIGIDNKNIFPVNVIWLFYFDKVICTFDTSRHLAFYLFFSALFDCMSIIESECIPVDVAFSVCISI